MLYNPILRIITALILNLLLISPILPDYSQYYNDNIVKIVIILIAIINFGLTIYKVITEKR